MPEEEELSQETKDHINKLEELIKDSALYLEKAILACSEGGPTFRATSASRIRQHVQKLEKAIKDSNFGKYQK